jgi:hypothetical protein
MLILYAAELQIRQDEGNLIHLLLVIPFCLIPVIPVRNDVACVETQCIASLHERRLPREISRMFLDYSLPVLSLRIKIKQLYYGRELPSGRQQEKFEFY